MTHFTKTAALLLTAAIMPVFATTAFADDMAKTDTMVKAHVMQKDHSFTKKSFKVKGDYSIVEENGQTIIRLSEDFKTRKGPDLKVFLSPLRSETVTGKNAVDGSLSLGALETNKGGSDYIVPEGVDLSLYQSLLIHCEAYSKLWGAAQL